MSAPLYHRESFVCHHVDRYGNPDFHLLFAIFQKAAVLHAEELGIGHTFYEPNNILFVLCRIKAKILVPFVEGKEYSLTTYALPPERIPFYRDAWIEDDQGQKVFLLRSLWVIISSTSRRLMLTDKICEQLAPIAKDLERLSPIWDERLEAIDEENSVMPIKNHVVRPEDIDSNRHMNNTVYIRLSQECGIQGPVSEFEIDFEKECLLGDTLAIYKGKEGYVSGYKDNQLSFKSRFTFRN